MIAVSSRVSAALVVALALASDSALAGDDKAIVQILTAAPSRASCDISPDLVFRSEQKVGRPFEKLCRINASESEVFAVKDLTGAAVEKARKLACTCGADALIVVYNTSDSNEPTYRAYSYGGVTKIKGKRTAEEVIAFGVRFIEKPRPRPTPMKGGFRDLAWGDPVPANFAIAEKKPPVSSFTHPGESLVVGPVTAQRIEYGFLEGTRLAHVTLTFARPEEAALLGFLTTMWGEPDAVLKDGSRSWGRSDEGTVVHLSIAEDRVVATIASRALAEEILRLAKERATRDAGL